MKSTRFFTVSSLILAFAFPSTLVMASAFCSEPSVPGCIRFNSGFTSKYEFDSCKSDMERYLRNVKDYQQCLQEEIDSKTTEANKAVKKFNCYASGEKVCF